MRGWPVGSRALLAGAGSVGSLPTQLVCAAGRARLSCQGGGACESCAVPASLADEALLRARDDFLGEVLQLPPMYSAIKVSLVVVVVAVRGRALQKAGRAGEGGGGGGW